MKGYRIYADDKPSRKGAPHYSLTVPRNIAERVPEETEFVPELTSAGILFKRVVAEAPEWANAEGSE